MILKPDIVKQILSGKRTVLRMPATGDCKLRLGHAYPIKTARDRPIAAHITIRTVETTTLEDVTLKEARKMGFRTAGDFWVDWHEQYGIERDMDDVWRIVFELGDMTDTDRIPAARPGPAGDYTSVAALSLRGTGSEVSQTIQGRYAQQAEIGQSAARSASWEDKRTRLLDVIAEIQEFEMTAKARKSLKGAEAMIRSMDRRIKTA